MRAVKTLPSFLAFFVVGGLFNNAVFNQPRPGLALVAGGFLLLLIWRQHLTRTAWYV